mgnify:CR=1 FL=1
MRRWVVMGRGAPGKGGHPATWAYGYFELALLFGMTEGAVRRAVCRKQLDPGDLASVLSFATARAGRRRA